MLIECTAIFLLITAVSLMYVRAKKKNYALATVPLLILPLANILAYAASGKLSNILPMDKFTVYAAINIIAVVISSCLVGVMSYKFPKKSTRTAYVIMSLIFNIILAAILVYNMFEALYR
ncbi:MAG: hypothetical protein K2N60_09665 [Oscillospiraceae bacterium]|nr:hypothetical protein [Oscillospiraceae bacterium]